MLRLISVTTIFLAFSLSGCSGQDEPPDNTSTNSRVSDDNVFKDQVRALEKAEDVQDTLNEAASRQREAIEEQGR